ncbi:hypothetical protein MIDIC_500013 [Alphaproteobacteria bacterium]
MVLENVKGFITTVSPYAKDLAITLAPTIALYAAKTALTLAFPEISIAANTLFPLAYHMANTALGFAFYGMFGNAVKECMSFFIGYLI